MIEVLRDARGKSMAAVYGDADFESEFILVPMLNDEAVIYARRTGKKETAQKTCICRLCGENIIKGEKRIAFEFRDRMIGRQGRFITGYIHVQECKTYNDNTTL
jgi:hypothetical protein